MSRDIWTEHIAGEMVSGLQACTRCLAVLNDYRNRAVLIEDLDQALQHRGWEPGPVYQLGPITTIAPPSPELIRRCLAAFPSEVTNGPS